MPTIDFADDERAAVTRAVRRTLVGTPAGAAQVGAGQALPGLGAQAGRGATTAADRAERREPAGEGAAVILNGAEA